MRALAAAAAVALAACGGGRPSPARPLLPAGDADLLTGAWRWTHAEDKDGVRRIEIEDWHLRGGSGWYRREVVLMAQDGVPFLCSQALSFRLLTTYQIRPRADRGGLWLEEVAFTTAPSRCEGGHRGTTRYRVAPAGRRALVSRSRPGSWWRAPAAGCRAATSAASRSSTRTAGRSPALGPRWSNRSTATRCAAGATAMRWSSRRPARLPAARPAPAPSATSTAPRGASTATRSSSSGAARTARC